MKIWTLVENTSCRQDVRAEHGLSLYIETGRHRILFDAGQTGAFAENAENMGLDLQQADMAILSHGHYDHGGGLRRFLELNHTAKIYVNRNAFQPHYHGPEKYIGLDPALREHPQIVLTGDKTELDAGLTLFTCNDRIPEFPVQGAELSTMADGKLVRDDFCHEQYLLVEEDGKRILFSGCSHKGILNIEKWFRPDILIGGFHFKNLDPEGAGRSILETAAARLLEYQTCYYTCHCTGAAPYAFLKKRMQDKLHYLSGGSVLEI